MRNPDVFPTRDGLFDTFQENLMKTCSKKAVAWGFTEDELKPFKDQQKVWKEAWTIASNKMNCTSAQTRAKNDARKAFQKLLRPFIQTRIHCNSLMTEADIISCGIKPHDLKRTRLPAPVTVPEVKFIRKGGKVVTIYFYTAPGDAGSSKRAMPKEVTGLFIIFQAGGKEPASYKEIRGETKTITRSPYVYDFQHVEVGETIYACARWQGTRGQSGPWTKVMKFILI